jgi:hypothetical protein
MSDNQSLTVIFNKSKTQVYVGSFSPSSGVTAHQQLLDAAPTKGANKFTGASIQGSTLAGGSETLNNKTHGKCQVDGRTLSTVKSKLESGDYTHVDPDGSTSAGVPLNIEAYKKYK